MSEVIGFKGAVPQGQAVPEIVELLEGLLERARSGEIHALAYAAARGEGDGFSSGWEGNSGTRDALGAALSFLHHRYYDGAFK